MSEPSAGSSIGGGAASGAAAGTMIAPGWGTAIGGAIGAAAGAANYFGGRAEARRRQRAIDRWKNRRTQILDSLLKEQRGLSDQQQALLTDEISRMTPTANVDVHQASEFATAPTNMDPTQAAAYQAALGNATQVGDAQAVANGENTRRGLWLQNLNDSSNQTQAGSTVGRNELKRKAFVAQTDLANNDMELNGYSPGNAGYNLQLLGSLLGAGSSTAIKLSGRNLSPSSPVMTTV